MRNVLMIVLVLAGCTGVHVPASDAGAPPADAELEPADGGYCVLAEPESCEWFSEKGQRFGHLGTPTCEANCPTTYTEECILAIIGANNCERFDEAAALCECGGAP